MTHEQEITEHEIIIDDFMEIRLKIPRRIDLLTFQGILERIKPFLKNIEKETLTNTEPKRTYTKILKQWTQEEIEKIRNEWDDNQTVSKNARRIGELLGRTEKSIDQVYYTKIRGKQNGNNN